MNAPLSLPFRLSESNFRRYEPYILRAVSISPDKLIIPTHGTALNTFMARLRDAMQSLDAYSWSTNIDLDKFRELRLAKQLQVSYELRDGVAYATLGHTGVSILYEPDSSLDKLSSLIITNHDSRVHSSLFILRINEVLTQPIHFSSPPDIEILRSTCDDFDLAYEIRGEDFIIL